MEDGGAQYATEKVMSFAGARDVTKREECDGVTECNH